MLILLQIIAYVIYGVTLSLLYKYIFTGHMGIEPIFRLARCGYTWQHTVRHSKNRTCAYTLLQLWDIVTKEQQIEYNGHKSWVYTVDFSPDGTQLVSGSADETIKVCTHYMTTIPLCSYSNTVYCIFED